jgi:two-component system phosphate regulon sensor histidine kinase PhoR
MGIRKTDAARPRAVPKTASDSAELAAAFSELAAANTILSRTLQAEKEKFTSIFHDTREGLILADPSGRILLINPAARALLGRQGRAVETIEKTLKPEFVSRPEAAKLLAGGETTISFEWERREPKLLILAGVADRLGKGEEAAYLFIFRDATIEKRGEVLSRDFLSLVSHKLRTPLTAALGFLELLKKDADGLPGEQKVALSKAHSESEKLRRLIEKLIAFSTVQSADAIVLERLETSIPDIVDSAVRSAGTAADPAVALKWDASACADWPNLKVDLLLLRETLANLIENAVKFNPGLKKFIEITAARDGDFIRIGVKDNGPGIPGEEQGKLFRKFYQIDEYFTCQAPGFGLGLAFAKNVVEAHGGRVGLNSEIGVGSEFWFTLPWPQGGEKR